MYLYLQENRFTFRKNTLATVSLSKKIKDYLNMSPWTKAMDSRHSKKAQLQHNDIRQTK